MQTESLAPAPAASRAVVALFCSNPRAWGYHDVRDLAEGSPMECVEYKVCDHLLCWDVRTLCAEFMISLERYHRASYWNTVYADDRQEMAWNYKVVKNRLKGYKGVHMVSNAQAAHMDVLGGEELSDTGLSDLEWAMCDDGPYDGLSWDKFPLPELP